MASSSPVNSMTKCSTCHFSSLNNLEYLLHQAENHMAVIKYHCKLCPETTCLKEAMTLHMMTKHLNLEIKDAENPELPEEPEEDQDNDEGRLVIDEKGLVVRKRSLGGGEALNNAGDYYVTIPTATATKKKRKRGSSAAKRSKKLGPTVEFPSNKLETTSSANNGMTISPGKIAFDPLPVIAQLKEPLEEYNNNKSNIDTNNNNNNHGQLFSPASPSCGKCGQAFSEMNKANQDHVRNCFASALGSEPGPNDGNGAAAAAAAFDSSSAIISLSSMIDDGKNVACTECNLRFKSKTGLALHVASVHRGIRYDCDICGTSYTQRPALNRHMKKVHSAPPLATGTFAIASAAKPDFIETAATSDVSGGDEPPTSTTSLPAMEALEETAAVNCREGIEQEMEQANDDSVNEEEAAMCEEMDEDYENGNDSDDAQGGVEVGKVIE